MAAGAPRRDQNRAEGHAGSASTVRKTTSRARPLAHDGDHEAHAERQRDERGAAIGDEGQCHALGRHQVQIDRHIDRALDAEEHDEARPREAAEMILIARGDGKAAHDDEHEDGHDDETGDDAEFLRRDGEDEVGMRVGQDALERAFAGALARPATGIKALQGGIDLERVGDAAASRWDR